VVVERILDVWSPVLAAVQSLFVSLVLHLMELRADLEIGLVLRKEEIRDDTRSIDKYNSTLCRGSRSGRRSTVQSRLAKSIVGSFNDTFRLLSDDGNIVGPVFVP
jgi:hypothetical protein